MFKTLKIICAISSVILFLSFSYLWNFHVQNSPRIYDKLGGYIYPLNNHGLIVYLTDKEHSILYATMLFGIVLVLLAAVFYYLEIKK
jgi:hypothetical protein